MGELHPDSRDCQIFYPFVIDGFNLQSTPQNSYDQDLGQQCVILRESYSDPLTVAQLEKIRSYTNAKDPEMLRAYLMELTRAKEAEFGKEAVRFDRPPDKASIAEWIRWKSLVNFYEEWHAPSPEGRVEYARKQGEPLTMPSGEKADREYTVSAIGPSASTLVVRSKKPDFPNAQNRDRVVASLGSGQHWYGNVGVIGFTAYRFESSEGKGFTVQMTPRGGALPLIDDDFK